MDQKWKDNRNKHLIRKMLDLEDPTITVKVNKSLFGTSSEISIYLSTFAS